MKMRYLIPITLFALFFITLGCNDNTENDKPSAFSGKLASHTGCKSMVSDSTINRTEANGYN